MEKYKFSDILKKLNNDDTDMLIYIQEQYRKGKIKEEELSEELIEKLLKLYDEQIEKLRESNERRKIKLKEYKERYMGKKENI